jgi:peptidoglycan-associated lipoprotein
MRLTILAAAATVFLAACSSAPKLAPVDEPAASVQPGATGAQTKQTTTAATRPEYLDPSSALARRHSVFFGFDDSAIRDQDKDIVELQGRYLATHPDVTVRLEGNTDERGGAEYNLALGQRRAEALAKALRVFGARDSQMETVSWGEEKPVAQGHEESAWTQNRRADVVYPVR